MTGHRRRKRFRPGSILLSLGALLGAACLLAAAVFVFLDIRPMVVSSGSMSPAIPAGSLALAQDTAAEEVDVGDVVAVSRADGTRVMHRVVAAEPSGGQVALTLQGDANAGPDAEIYVVDRVLAVRFDVPWLGYPVSWLSTTWGLMALGAGAFGLLVFAFRRTGAPTAGRRRVAAFLALPLATVMVSMAASPSSAFFTDTGTVTSGSLTTYTVPKPVWVSCTVTGGLGQKTATIVWQEVSLPLPLNYLARVVSPNTPMTVTDNGSTRQTQFSAGLLSTVVNQTYNIEIRAALPAPNGSWQSVVLIQPVTISLLGLGMSCGTPT